MGDIHQFKPFSEYFAARGMVAFTADYRVKSRHNTTPFEAVEDAKDAVKWIRRHAEELGVNVNQIVSAGGSAGGHLAACTAIFRDDITEGPHALILFNPVTDTTEETGFGSERMNGRAKELSCTHHITSGLPPTLMFHGTNDVIVSFDNSQAFCEQMRNSHNRCELVPFEGKGHGFFNYRENSMDAFEKTRQLADEFLQSLSYLGSEK